MVFLMQLEKLKIKLSNRKNLFKLVFVLSVFIILIIIIIGIYHNYQNNRKNEILNNLLLEADNDIKNNSYVHARYLINLSVKSATNTVSWHRILKRSYYLSKQIHDYSFFKNVALQAVKNKPGQEELWSFVVFAYLHTGDFTSAYETAENHLKTRGYDLIKTEALIKANVNSQLSENISVSLKPLIDSSFIKDPMIFKKAAEITGDKRYYLDAALIYIYMGDTESAYRITEKWLSGNYPEVCLQIAYNAGRYNKALIYYETLERKYKELSDYFKLFKSDIYLKTGRFNAAEDIYDSFIKNNPSFSPVPFHNLFWLKLKEGHKGISYLEDGYQYFPDSKEIILPYTENLFKNGDTQKAISILLEYILTYDDIPAEILYLQLSTADLNPKRYTSALWKLFNKYPDNRTISRFFALYLLNIGDLNGCKILLDRFTTLRNDTDWSLFYKGIYFSLQNNLKNAKNLFSNSLKQRERYQTLYNLGIIEYSSGNYSKALEYLQKAYELTERNLEINETAEKARIKIKTGQVMYSDNKPEDAVREIIYGLSIDPYNLEGLHLLRKLEITTN